MANGDPVVENPKEDPVVETRSDQVHPGFWWIDLIREITRNLIGGGAIAGSFYILYRFVMDTPVDERLQVMLLVIGWLGGFVSGIGTWYFGSSMRSATQQAQQAQQQALQSLQQRQNGK